MKIISKKLFSILGIIIIIISIFIFSSCASKNPYLGKAKFKQKNLNKTATMIKDYEKFISFQQTTDYTCGPAALLSVASFYNKDKYPQTKKTEMKFAKEIKTNGFENIPKGELPGTREANIIKWLKYNGFVANLSYETKEDYSQLTKLYENINNNNPTIVLWSDWGGALCHRFGV
ncbi:MAG: C39 family peptidase [Pseudomonadota bacterium]